MENQLGDVSGGSLQEESSGFEKTLREGYDLSEKEVEVLRGQNIGCLEDVRHFSVEELAGFGLPVPCARRLHASLREEVVASSSAYPDLVTDLANSFSKVNKQNAELASEVERLNSVVANMQAAHESDRKQWLADLIHLKEQVEAKCR